MGQQNAEGNETYMACRPLTEKTKNHTSTNACEGIFFLLSRVGKLSNWK